MTEETKRTAENPAFDSERAWKRFEALAAQEPAPDFWRRAEKGHLTEQELPADKSMNEIRIEDNPTDWEKEREWKMKQALRGMNERPVAAAQAAGDADSGRAWQTERATRQRLRRWTAGAAAAVLALGLFVTPWGDRVLASMQHSFRIQHMVGVGITADDMAAISGLLDHGSPEGDRSFSLAQFGSLTQSGGGPDRPLSWEEADRLMGGSLLRLENASVPSYRPATTLTFRLQVKPVNRLLTRLGGNAPLPAAADGKAIRLAVPDSVDTEGTLSGHPARLLQFGRPELTVEEGIDPASVREAILGLPVLPESLRSKLAAIGDWRNTLPVPTRDGAISALQVDGHDAVLSSDESHRYLLWLDGDQIRLLSANTEDFHAVSDFRQAAEEWLRR
ncbi:hypothetical protein [Gorillibacterium sp. sgz500922]|uniref:hypothetical protein n=1 Tax=Gorillibacterium sp. sgz500922 TaxID=3446694 RepID=UPI003F6778B6